MKHNQLKVFLNIYPVKNIVIFTELGHTSWRRYDLYNNNDKKKEILTHPVYRPFKAGIFFNVGIALRVRLEE